MSKQRAKEVLDRDPITAKSKLKMRAKPNWEVMEAEDEETPDRFRVPPGLIPDSLSAQWVTDSVFGQAQNQHRSNFEKRGWTPVHQEDFDGVLDGKFMPKGRTGEIILDGMVLMVRPREMTEKAELKERRKALEQVAIKERALRSGDLPNVSLDSQHPSAVNTNRVSKTYERVEIPDSD